MLKNVKTVLFDMDGTLIDSMWVWKEIDKEYLGKYGLKMPENFQSKISGMSFLETAVCFKETFAIPETIEEMMDTWNSMAVEKYRSSVPLKPGAFTFLEYLKKTDRKTAICTSNSRYLTEVVLQSLEIENMFDSVLTADEKLKGKPAPDIYLRACDRLHSSPEECLVFEDIYRGVLAGQRARMKVCAIKDDFSRQEWNDMQNTADYMINDFTELEPYLQ